MGKKFLLYVDGVYLPKFFWLERENSLGKPNQILHLYHFGPALPLLSVGHVLCFPRVSFTCDLNINGLIQSIQSYQGNLTNCSDFSIKNSINGGQYTLRKKSWNYVGFLHTLRFVCFVPMSSGRALEVQHFKWTSFQLQSHFHKFGVWFLHTKS